MMLQIILFLSATALVTMPQWFSTLSTRRHAARLAQLRDGASERYFEERRSLETYRPYKRLWLFRLWGLSTMAYVIGTLIFRP